MMTTIGVIAIVVIAVFLLEQSKGDIFLILAFLTLLGIGALIIFSPLIVIIIIAIILVIIKINKSNKDT